MLKMRNDFDLAGWHLAGTWDRILRALDDLAGCFPLWGEQQPTSQVECKSLELLGCFDLDGVFWKCLI